MSCESNFKINKNKSVLDINNEEAPNVFQQKQKAEHHSTNIYMFFKMYGSVC